ncbi:hypothetical protein Pyn_26245 [Prunus yedoensis var. nudiflora]|uniref:Uncharacterized protein n=1 Tax=Prunus yedoensis var. nudiflora TaxID=2094558 RepID=A0A314YSF8_PRUYE|nr:hypothetical protein Pyn_26245 [Prunus yedoensis var. nudiflora]
MNIEKECSEDRPYVVGEDTLLLEALKEKMRRNPGSTVSPLPPASCIFKVPEALRRHNPKAYEPHVVSIGPFHRGRDHPKLQRMETSKQWYLDTLLNRMDISLEIFIEIINKEAKEGIIEFEKRARSFYAEPLDHLSQSEFIEIMILDGCFIIQLLWKIVNGEKDDDPILKMDCMYQYVCHDLLLLENQLPWFVLSTLYGVTLGKCYRSPPFSTVLFEAFCAQKSLKKYFNSYLQSLDKTCPKIDQKSLKKEEESALHILDLIRFFIVLEWEPEKEESKEELESDIPPATALSEAGVKFKKDDSAKNLLNIKFDNGVLKIPELAVAELTEPLLRNLIAFEQCYHGRSHQITSYAIFMDKLISSEKDIQLLSEEKILANWLNVEDGSKFFNSLYIDTTVKEFQYDKLCAEVNKYHQVKWNKYLEQLRRDHFSSPWKVIALTVGILILILQLLQFILRVLPKTSF